VLRVVLVVLATSACGRRHFDGVGDAAPPADEAAPVDAAVSTHTFFDDFEGGLVWEGPEMTGGGQGMQQDGTYVVTLDADGDSVKLTKALPAPTTSVTLGMRLEYATTNAGNNCEIDFVHLDWASGACTPFGFYLVRDGQTSTVDLQQSYGAPCAGNVDNPGLNLENTGPHDYVMTMTLGDNLTSHIRLEIDGDPVVDTTPAHPIGSADLSLWIGAGGVRNLAGTWTFTYDSVYVDVL
jgi:hypothetical protein